MWMRHAAAVAASLLAGIVVVDGDTVKVDRTLYRLLGCDAPETRYAKCELERYWGRRATERLKELVETTEPTLVPDGRQCGWGRPCAHLYVDGQDACRILIQEGFARPCGGRRCRYSWCD